MNQNDTLQTSCLITVALIALALCACAAHTPKPLCHGPLTPINTAPTNAPTPPSATK